MIHPSRLRDLIDNPPHSRRFWIGASLWIYDLARLRWRISNNFIMVWSPHHIIIAGINSLFRLARCLATQPVW